MQKIINVVFRIDVDNGLKAGTGHLKRSIIIKKNLFLNKKKFKCFYLYKNLKNSKKIISKYQRKNLILYNEVFEEKLKFLKKKDIFIFDTPYGLDNRLNNFLKKNNYKRIVLIDDLNKPKNKSAIVFNGIKYFRKKLPKSGAKKIYQGFKYILLDEIYSKRKKVKLRNEILIGSGGTDNKHNLIKILNKIEKFKKFKFLVIIGDGVNKNNPINKIKLKNVKLLKNVKNLFKYYIRVKACIISGGIMMFEALALNKKILVHQMYNHQKNSINFFLKKNFLTKIGENKRLFINKLYYELNNLNNTKNMYHNNIIDGKAIFRLKKIIKREFLKNV